MKSKALIPVLVVSGILFVYLCLIFSGNGSGLTSMIFFASPFLLVWMALSIIRHGKFTGQELKEGEEWGYSDRRKDDLGVF